jgi:predicted nucleotidyltransferase component of viral defense system
MDSIVLTLLEEYQPKTTADYENALKEIMQEIALLGLWRAKFYEHALFYGGTALRILHKLPRFSEDLDFSLLKPNPNFDLTEYHQAIQAELEAFVFTDHNQTKKKTATSQIESAFIKASTKTHLLRISAPPEINSRIQGNQLLKIKIELDLDPPSEHGIEVLDLDRPIPFQIKTMPLPDLFAGKVHAVLARKWQSRVKGRDFYDYIWYLGRDTPLNLKHLEARLRQSGHFDGSASLTAEKCRKILTERFQKLDTQQARQDVEPFLNVREKASLTLWSPEYFLRSLDRLTFQ